MSLIIAAAMAIAGAIIGSFVATLCLRWPRGEQVTSGRSHCDHCGTSLGVRDLFPVASIAIAGGHCRSCRAPVDPFHLHVELAAAAIGAAAMAHSPDAQGAALALFGWLLLPLALLDARHFWLPDRLTLALGLCGLAGGGLLSDLALADRLVGGAVGFGVLALLAAGYRLVRGFDGLGAGDAKLLGAIGLWTGPLSLAPILLLASLAGLAAAAARRRRRHDALPFGALLAAGAVVWMGLIAAAPTEPARCSWAWAAPFSGC